MSTKDSTAPQAENAFTDLGARVRIERQRRNLSQANVALTLRLSEQAVVDIEDGKRALSALELLGLAEAFDLAVEHFVTPFSLTDNEILAWSEDGPSTVFPAEPGECLSDRLSLFQWLRSKTHVGQLERPVFDRCLRLPADPTTRDVEQLADQVRTFWDMDGKLQSLQDALREELNVQVLWLEGWPQGHIAALARLDREDVLVLRMSQDRQRLAEAMAQTLFHLCTVGALPWSAPKSRMLAALFAVRFLQDSKPNDLPMEAHEGQAFGSELMARMLHEALDRGLLSARKAANLMHMSLHELSEEFKLCGLKSPFEL